MYRHSTAFFTNAVLAVTDSIFPHIKALECNAKLGAVGASFHITRLEKKNSNVLSMVTFCSRYTRALTYENLSFHITSHEAKWLAAHAFLTVLKSAAYQHLRSGAHTSVTIAHTISQLEVLLSSLEARGRAQGEQTAGSEREGVTLLSEQLQRLTEVARVAFDSQLRSLRC